MVELNELKVGEEVYYSNGLTYGNERILKITRITRTMIICGNSRFRKDNGNIVGNSSSWEFPEIRILTNELKEKVYHKKLINDVTHFNWERLTYPQLKEIWEIINRMNKNQEVIP